jgi:hypothetical protein
LTDDKTILILPLIVIRIILNTIKTEVLYGITYALGWIRPDKMGSQNQETFLFSCFYWINPFPSVNLLSLGFLGNVFALLKDIVRTVEQD